MFRPANDLILKIFAQVPEIITVASYPYDQIGMLLRMPLCLPESFRRHDIELYMVAVHPEIAADQVDYFFQPIRSIEE